MSISYRSRSEDLIAYSNKEIYKNELITFPSNISHQQDVGIEFIQVDGIYSRGKNRNNVVEAKKVADLIIDHIAHYPTRSLGVVAFSVAQRNTIMKELKQRISELEKFNHGLFETVQKFISDESKKEPFFIKNLENVQGDERDVIIFSICYAKDNENGELFYNLGKLTQEAGKKRINVAITRSKIGMKIVCSFDPDLMIISNEKQTGLKMLKGFLQYAKRVTNGSEMVDNATSNSKDFLAKDIKKELEKRGYQVKELVGRSQYKIDLAVLKPDSDNEYILAIMLDGDTYHNCKSVRDREKLGITVLRNLGWNIYNVWATDYYRNRDLVLNLLEDAIEKARQSQEEVFKPAKTVESIDLKDVEDCVYDRTVNLVEYQKFDYNSFIKTVNPKLAYSQRLKTIIISILNIEGSIHLIHMADRIAPFFELSDINENLVKLVKDKIIEVDDNKEIVEDNGFYYLKSKYAFYFRRPVKGLKRNIVGIYYKELADLMYRVCDSTSGMEKEILENQVIQYCGYNENSELTNDEKQTINKAYQYLLDKQYFDIRNNLIYTK